MATTQQRTSDVARLLGRAVADAARRSDYAKTRAGWRFLARSVLHLSEEWSDDGATAGCAPLLAVVLRLEQMADAGDAAAVQAHAVRVARRTVAS